MTTCIQSSKTIKHIHRKEIRFVLEFENNLYVVIKKKFGSHIIFKSKWNPYQGFEYVKDNVPKHIVGFADKILNLNQTDSAKYPLAGEWYLARIYDHEGVTRLNIRRIKKRSATAFHMLIPFAVHILTSILMGVFALLLCAEYAKGWLSALFPLVNTKGIEYLLWSIELIGVLTLFALFEERRGIFGLLLNSYIPIGIIVIIGLIKCYWWMWIVLPIGICITGFLAFLYMVIIEELQGKWYEKLSEYLRGSLIVLFILLIPICSLSGLSSYTYRGESSEMSGMSIEEIEKDHRSLCQRLEVGVWETLSEQEKINILQGICDYECTVVLGCPTVTVQSGMTEKDTILGTYTHGNRVVTINSKHLRDGDVRDVVNTAIHEVRHAYQHAMAEMYASLSGEIEDEYKNLYPFQQAQLFADNLEHYCHGKDGFDEYYYQEVEKDCRDWSEQRIIEYYIYRMYPDR